MSANFDKFKIRSFCVDGFDHQAKNAEMGLDIESVDC